MSRHATDFQEEGVPSPPLPADHVLSSAAVLFPGAFDQHGCPLIVFPVNEQAKLSSELSKAEVVDFVNYFLCLHNKKQEKQSLVSVVADLKHASLLTTRVIAETLLLLELHKRTVHSVYIIQPKKKDVVRLLLKILAPSKSYAASFKKVLLKEISELSNYIDRSQLTASLGGYLIYCHHSWVAFIKEIDEFVQEFLSVVQRLPSCISTLQALSRLAMPSTFSELQRFCSTNEAKFQQLRRELGLDELLSHCESVVEKLRHPEKEPCYQAMAGTALFTHTAFDMLRNHSRITAAVEKVELLWQQAFSKARLELQVFQLREDALQITEEIKTLLQDKLQPYKIRIAKDAAKAAMLLSEFEASIHTPAMALIRCAEDVIHTVAEILLVDGQTGERWVLDLERLKEKLHSAVLFILQTLRAVSNYHHHYNKANSWYSRVLCENVLQVLLSGVNADPGGPTLRQRRNRGTVPAWRYKVSTFLKNNPPPDVEALLHLAHLSNAIPDDEVREVGKRMSQRCMTLRKLLIGLGPVAVGHLQLALQWQYDFLRSSHVNRPSVDGATNGAAKVVQDPGKCESVKEAARLPRTSPSTAVSGTASAEAKPSSLSSFDSGFDGAGSSQLEAWGGRDGVDGLSRLAGSRDSARPATTSQTLKENISSVSDCEDHREEFDVGSVGNSSRSSIQIIPKVTVDSLNVEIKVKRSAALPNNPWLSLPVDDLEKSYTVTITQNPTPQKRNLRDPSDPRTSAESNGSRDQRTQMEVLDSAQARRPQSRDSRLHSQSTLEDPELSPIRNVLSSTITDGRDESVCTTEGIPTLLWDSYDLHDQNQETVDSAMDLSLNDWDVKEQEGLREVEKILDRADEILEKEENVLAQEAVLDALLRSEDGHNQWPLWASEHQLGAMSSSELAEAGVLGLEDDLDPAESDLLSESRTGSASETKASEEDDGHCTEAATEAEAFRSRSDLLTELRNVCVLDELIREENLKIHELRSCKEKISREELSAGKPPSDTNVASSTSKEREAFRLQLEKEKREVEKLEKSLDKERNVKKRKDGARRVVKCSIMERARSDSQEDQALCDALLSGNRSQRTLSTSLVQNDSQVQETCETENIPAVLGPNVAEEATPQDLVQLPDSQYQDDCCGAEPSVVNLVPLNSSCDLKEAPEEVGIQPQGCINGNKLDQALCDMLLSGSCSRSQRTHSTSLVQDDSQETCETENIPAVLGPDVAEEATPQDLVQLPDCQYQDDCCGAEPSVVNLVLSNSRCDLKEAPEEVGVQPQGCIDGNKLDQALCDALLSGSCSRSQRTHSTSLVQDDSQETCETENIPAVLGPPNVAEEAIPKDLVQLPDSQYQDDCCGAEPLVFNLVPLNSSCDLKEAHEEVVIQPQGCIDGNKLDQALCDALLSGSCSRSQRTHSTSLVQDDSQETCETENIPAVLGPDVAEEATPQDLVQLPDSQYQDDCCGAEPSVFNLVPLNSRCDLKDAPEELGIQPQGCIDGNKLDRAGENASEMRPDDGAFDPGGKSHLPPVPKPRLKASLPVNNDLAEHKPPHSKESSVALDLGFARPDRRDEPLDALPEGETPAVNPNVKEQSNNNNNHALTETCSGSLQHLSNEITAEGKEDSSVVPACLPQTDLQPAEADHQSAAAQLPPDQPLEFDPGGEDEQDEEVPDGVQSYESMRMPGSGSAGFQAQLNINMREMTDFKTPIVLDTGSGLMKAGFADQDLPNVIFPTIIGMPKYEEIMNGNFEKETYIGHGAQHMRGVLALKHPIKNGIICNWDEMEKIWHHTFQQLGVDPEDHPVLLTEAAMNPSANRQRMVEIMFERFAVPFAYVAMQAVLALYAAGRSTGVVLDSGDGVSHSVPVFEGYSLSHAVQRFPLAGVDVTMHLKKLLQEQGVSMRSTAEMEIVREMKERCCCVAVNYEAELSQGGASCREMYYTMPDGQIVTLGTERFRAPEILFKPELIGRDHYGIHKSVFKSILRSDIDLRRCLLGNIVLSGGNTLLPGFPERLQAEIKGLVPANMGDGVRVTSPKDRDFSVWSGGAVLANLPSFSAAWISQEEYDEHGPQIVFRKCF